MNDETKKCASLNSYLGIGHRVSIGFPCVNFIYALVHKFVP